METLPYNICAISRQAFGRREPSSRFIHSPFCQALSLVRWASCVYLGPLPNHDFSGECAQHFQQILQKFPPQVSTRSDAAAWGCHVHNEVNKSLKKELFDCSNIGDFYDCGCAGNDEGLDTKEKPDRAIVSIGGLNGESGNTERQS